MFVDFRNAGPLPEAWRPPPPAPRLTPRQRTAVAWIAGFNVVMLFVAPLAGATLFDALAVFLTK